MKLGLMVVDLFITCRTTCYQLVWCLVWTTLIRIWKPFKNFRDLRIIQAQGSCQKGEEDWKFWMPNPPQMNNHGNYVVSLSQFCKWLGQKAEDLGADILPGFPASGVITKQAYGPIVGVTAKEADSGQETNIYSKYTLLAEGCRGSISEDVIRSNQLRIMSQAKPQTYGLGLKEIWEISPEKHKEGHVMHTIGYPLHETGTYGGGFVYHMSNNLLSIGLVLGLDYSNPHLETFQEFQRFKNHPSIRKLLEGGRRLEYGARALNEGGSQNIPFLEFPGGALLGCSAGFMNVAKIKGTHTAMKSGILAAETLFPVLTSSSKQHESEVVNLEGAYDKAVRNSWILQELKQVRNIRPGFKWGLFPGLANAALEAYVFRGKAPWTLSKKKQDHEQLRLSSESAKRSYDSPDGVVSFDIPSSLYTSGTNHDEKQPCHLKLRDADLPQTCNLPIYNGPEASYCPAGVYEYAEDKSKRKKKKEKEKRRSSSRLVLWACCWRLPRRS
eukprot:TRINITY_DN786_c2_g1_i1.p1 TRINITY_DN786_c2_g1~~TRINITY_DN786_c2_g1_i1.p1  ORF type:complete len:498 (-),score=40.09 TRINITY_DN786_c2_g1_i1:27-1520(-)